MTKILLALASFIFFLGVSAQNKNYIEKYTAQKPQYGFIENKGQIHDQNYKANPDVKYLLCLGNGMKVQLKANGFSYDTYKTEVKEKIIDDSFDKMRPNNEPRKDITYYFHRVDVELVGANTNPEIIAEEPSADYLNYYNAVTPESGATNVRNYGKITYKDIYHGIDMVFVARPGKERPVEYEFIVHPGADAEQIKLHYVGANRTQLSENKINIDVAHGRFTESIPASWIKETNDKLNITYRALDTDIYCFEIPSYAPTQTLIIDPNPTLDWGTYYGGSGIDHGLGISCDTGGNVLVTGYTYSTTGIATSGAHQVTFGGGDYDAFVVKYNSNGVRQWGTYYGGSWHDYGQGISCDAGGNVFVTGYTSSNTGIATSGAHQETYTGSYDYEYDAFVVKFNSAGVRQWGTYYGGSGIDGGYGISCDGNGNVFVTGHAKSATGIATGGAHQETNAGKADAFVVKFNSNGVRQWGTYCGGSETDAGYGISCDAGGNVFVTGNTSSTTGITTSGAHQVTFAGGVYDAFIIKFNSNGVRQWGTYYGGSGHEYGQGISCDAGGNVFVTGHSSSNTGISTSGAHQETYADQYDAFVVKFNSAGVRQWGTYYGGSGIDAGYGISCDAGGNVFVTGTAYSTTGIATSGAHQITGGGNYDAFVVKFNSAGVRQWGTYYGGSGIDGGYGISCDGNGNVFVTGNTESTTGIATSGAHQETYAGLDDAFVARFSTCDIYPANAGLISGPTSVCQSQNSVIYSVPLIANATSYVWTLPFGATGTSDTNSISVDFGLFSGNITVIGTNICIDGVSSSLYITLSFPDELDICYVEYDTLTQKNIIFWSLPQSNSTDSVYIYREQTFGVWVKIGSVLFSEGSYVDLTSNPVSQSYNYKISAIDTCSYEGVLSPSHKTITLIKSYDQLSNTYGFSWSAYTGMTVSEYNVYGVESNGNASIIGTVPSNIYMYNYTNPSLLYVNYFVGFDTPACGAKTNHTVRSNYVSAVSTDIEENVFSSIIIYPNPVTNELIIEAKDNKEAINFEIFNSLGQIIFKGDLIEKTVVQTTNFTPGVYLIKLESDNTFGFKKIVKQ
ncbi:MAG TPA: T9SS type A sorting domain-containing protein [Bacteroidales bacterium]|nr:T9SS type A sorting domain-containing protein [Bacteroidales bacterium]